LIAAFVAKRPDYLYVPEAYETLADDVALTSSEGPDLEGLAALLEYTRTTLAGHPSPASVVFERSPVDYLAYAAATRAASKPERAAFLKMHVPRVRASVRRLDLIVFLPVSRRGPIRSRADEDDGFRRRVDDRLRRALIDDDYGLFAGRGGPVVAELSTLPDRQLAELMRRTAHDRGR
jgi:hypothetical protein